MQHELLVMLAKSFKSLRDTKSSRLHFGFAAPGWTCA